MPQRVEDLNFRLGRSLAAAGSVRNSGLAIGYSPNYTCAKRAFPISRQKAIRIYGSLHAARVEHAIRGLSCVPGRVLHSTLRHRARGLRGFGRRAALPTHHRLSRVPKTRRHGPPPANPRHPSIPTPQDASSLHSRDEPRNHLYHKVLGSKWLKPGFSRFASFSRFTPCGVVRVAQLAEESNPLLARGLHRELECGQV